MRRVALVLALLLAAAASVATVHATGPLAIRARTFDGVRWHDGALVTMRDGVVVALSTSDSAPPKGVALLEVPGAVLTPGLVDCDSSLGLAEGRDELGEASSSDLLLADSFAPDAGESAALRRSGVTLAWLAAGETSIVGGQGALVQPTAGDARVLMRSRGLTASLCTDASLPERAPTSRAGQRQLLLDLDTGVAPPHRLRFDDGASANLAAGLRSRGFTPVGLPDAPEAVNALAGQPLILSGLDATIAPTLLRLAADAARRTPFALGSGSSIAGPRALRHAAAALVASGVDADRVLAALTSEGGRLADGRRGVIAPGRPADLVLWSGHPTSPASRVLRAWVSGEEVFHEE